MSAIAISYAIGTRIPGGIMSAFDGVAGLRDWHWLFLIDARPPSSPASSFSSTSTTGRRRPRAGALRHPGHTELLADLLGADPDDVFTMFVVGKLRIFFLTRHLSLRDADRRADRGARSRQHRPGERAPGRPGGRSRGSRSRRSTRTPARAG